MGNCKDCRWWQHHTDVYNKSWADCAAADWVDRDSRIGDADMAVYAEASDDHGLNAGLKTGPMFGCVQFQLSGKKVSPELP